MDYSSEPNPKRREFLRLYGYAVNVEVGKLCGWQVVEVYKHHPKPWGIDPVGRTQERFPDYCVDRNLLPEIAFHARRLNVAYAMAHFLDVRGDVMQIAFGVMEADTLELCKAFLCAAGTWNTAWDAAWAEFKPEGE